MPKIHLFLLFLCSFAAIGQPALLNAGTYKDSAHGSSSIGVKRTDTKLQAYSQGNCAHCHEQHASIDGGEPVPASGNASPFALFAPNFNLSATINPYQQGDNFCFYCHTSVSSLQSGGIDNKDYTATFGGYTTDSPLGIFQAFNLKSYHNLKDIVVFAEPKFTYFKATSNPCVACHNPHIARRNKANVKDPAFTAISKPSDHDNLWGNDAAEKMNVATGNFYKSPYYYNSTTTYEPGAAAVSDGSLTPDYNAFCTDCHNTTNTIYSTSMIPPNPAITTPGTNLTKINWYTLGGDIQAAGDKHGKNAATGNSRRTNPYGVTNGWVLSCLDCHEPHGSANEYLLRRETNGTTATGFIHKKHPADTESTISFLCVKCHSNDMQTIHHFDAEAPYNKSPGCACHGGGGPGVTRISCEQCHYHGAYVTNCDKTLPTTRRTF